MDKHASTKRAKLRENLEHYRFGVLYVQVGINIPSHLEQVVPQGPIVATQLADKQKVEEFEAHRDAVGPGVVSVDKVPLSRVNNYDFNDIV